jgi:hypothetical protein
LTLMPDGTAGVIRMDVSAWFRNPWARDFLDSLSPSLSDQQRMVLGFAEEAQEVIVAFTPEVGPETSDGMLLAARGDFTETLLRFDPNRMDSSYREHALHSHDGKVMSFVGTHTWVDGRSELVRQALDRADGSLPAATLDDPGYDAYAARGGLRAHSFTFWLGAGVFLRGDALQQSLVRSVLSLSGWLDIEHSLRGQMVLSFVDADASAVSVLETVARNQLQAYADRPDVSSSPLGPVLRAVQIRSEGSDILAELSLPEEELATLMAHLTQLAIEAVEAEL